jgi:hypothetical protein
MPAPLLCDDHKNWVAVDQQITSPDFLALSLAIQGLGVTHHWLRKMEYEFVMNGLVEKHDPELYRSYQRTWAANARQAEIQPTFYFAMYWVKSLAEVVAIIRNGRGVRGGEVYKERLNKLAKTLNIIRQPLAKHQIAEASDLLFPLPILILGQGNCIGWRVIDKKGEEHTFSRVYLAERFIKDVLDVFLTSLSCG